MLFLTGKCHIREPERPFFGPSNLVFAQNKDTSKQEIRVQDNINKKSQRKMRKTNETKLNFS